MLVTTRLAEARKLVRECLSNQSAFRSYVVLDIDGKVVVNSREFKG